MKMSLRNIGIASMITAGGIAFGTMSATTATAEVSDPCRAAVSSSRCLGPSGIAGFSVPEAGDGATRVGPYGTWGWTPPLG